MDVYSAANRNNLGSAGTPFAAVRYTGVLDRCQR